jgi:hypothetical protein
MKSKYIELCCSYAVSTYFYTIKLQSASYQRLLLITIFFCYITKDTVTKYNIIPRMAMGSEYAIFYAMRAK